MPLALIHFLKNLLRDTLSLSFNYYSYPFTDISDFDFGFRKGLDQGDQLYQQITGTMSTLENNTFYHYSDDYQLHYYLFRPSPSHKDVITVGPYLDNAVTPDLLTQLTQLHHLSFSELENVRTFMNQIPVFVNNLSVLSVLKDIVNYITPDVSSFKVVDFRFTDSEKNSTHAPLDHFHVIALATENRYQIQREISEAVGHGDYASAISACRKFMSVKYASRLADAISDKKISMYAANTALRLAVEDAGVHPVFIHDLSTKYMRLIYEALSAKELDILYEKMIRGYCLLVQNKARNQYSQMVRDTLNYIDFNLDQQIFLTDIAESLHITPQYLSKVFKKEIGSTISEYILELRIHKSMHLLNTTDMRIQEISEYVGISDYNYFTKLFKRYVGLTPTEYRKNLHR